MSSIVQLSVYANASCPDFKRLRIVEGVLQIRKEVMNTDLVAARLSILCVTCIVLKQLCPTPRLHAANFRFSL